MNHETMHVWETDHNGEAIEYPVPSSLARQFGAHSGPRCKLCGANPCVVCEGFARLTEQCPAWLTLFDIEKDGTIVHHSE